MKEIVDLLPFSFLQETGKVIALVGAGGKTTWMFRMADYYSRRGERVLVTTTTHMMEPQEQYRAYCIEDAKRLWKQGKYAVVGSPAAEGKIGILKREELAAYEKEAQIVLMEADGAKRMPCKVPAEHEPVILPECNVVVGVMGMDSLGKPLQEVCFRAEYAKKLLKKSGKALLTEEDMGKILASLQGTRKNVGTREYCVILNKCNDEERKAAAGRIRGFLEKEGIFSVGIV